MRVSLSIRVKVILLVCVILAATGEPLAETLDYTAPNAVQPGQKIHGQSLITVAGDFDASQIAGADYLRQMQADITDDNAGNGVNGINETPDDPDDGGWDWSVTSPPAPFHHTTTASPRNIYGATIAGIYYAYLETADAIYFTAMTDAANVIRVNPDIRTASDYIFLMNYNDLPGVAGTSYMDSAKAKFDTRIASQGSPAAWAQYVRDARNGQGYGNGIIAWDIGFYVVAAAMLEDRYPGDPNDYGQAADDMAEVLWQDSFNDNPGYFDIIDDAGWEPAYDSLNFWWYTLGLTGLIDAFNLSDTHTDEIPGLVTRLLDSQFSNGAISFSYGANDYDEDWQSTAYAMMSLGRLDQSTYQAEINRMAFWVSATQDASGGWVYSSGSHYPEIGGECTAGLYFSTNDVSDVLVDDSFTSQDDVDIYNTANGTHYVWGYDAFETIQEGVDAVNGSTVNVLPGTYREQIYIDESLDLVGSGSGSCVIEAADLVDRTTYSVTQWTGTARTIDAIIGVNDAGTVNISGFTIDGRDLGPDNFYGIHYFNTSGSVTNCVIDNVIYASVPGAQHVVSVVATHGLGDTFTIDISTDTIPTFQKGGIVVMGPGATFTVMDNYVSGVVSSDIAGNCIQLSYGATGSTSGNIVEGTTYTGSDWASTGILLFESGDVTMNGDEVYDCESGVNFSDWGYIYNHPSPVNLSFNNLNLHDNEWTLGAQLSRDNSDPIIDITACEILSSTGDGIDIFGTGPSTYYSGWSNGDLTVNIDDCNIRDAALDGIWTGDFSGNANNVDFTVYHTDFTGNTGSAINNTFAQTIDATECYWNSVNGPVQGMLSGNTRTVAPLPRPFDAELQDSYEPSKTSSSQQSISSVGETIYGPVDYDPWCSDETHTYCGLTSPVTEVWVDDDWVGSSEGDIVGGHIFGYDAFATIQDGINGVGGSTVNISNGTYYETLDINENLVLNGESEAGVLIDASGFSDYGIYVTGDYTVTLQNFTLIGPTPTDYGYGVKVSGENADITVSNVTSQNCGRSGIDLNGVVAGLIQNVSSLSNGGAGLALTDCENVTVSGITTSGNAWAGIGIYTQGTYHSGGSDNITINGTNSIAEIPPIYTETGGGYPITNLDISISDFPYTVGNNLAPNITAYFADFTTAAAAAIGADPINSFINQRSDGSFIVPPGLTIQAAATAAGPGDLINVLAGTFNESVTFGTPVTLTGAGTTQTFVTGGIAIAAGVSGLSIQHIYITGSAVSGQNSVIRALGTNTDFTIDNCVIDGEGIAGRYGYTGGSMEGNVIITNCEMKNVPGWALWDSRSGSGGDGSAMDTIVFANNYIHECDGSIVFRGLSTDRTEIADVHDNTWENIGDNYASPSQHWAAFEMNRTVDFLFYNNIIDNVALGQWGEGQGLQIWDIDNLDVHDNDFTNCHQGIWVYCGGTFSVPGGSIYHNDLLGSTDYAVGVDATCVGVDTLDAEENYWGTVNYSSISTQVQGAVDFSPWCSDTTHIVCTLTFPITEVWVDDDWAGSSEGDIVEGHVFGYDAFATVQDGVDGVYGSTVNVANGTYVEGPQIVIDTDISIIGESKEFTIITPSANTGSSGDSRGWFLVPSGYNLNMSNVTLDGSGFQIYQAIRAFGTGTLDNNIFQNLVYSSYIGFALAHLNNWNITNNTFSNIGRVGVLSFGTDVTSSNISGNTYTGKGDGDWLDYAFEAGAGAVVSISNNTITNCTGVALSDSSTSAGILATTYFGLGTDVTISGNDISGSSAGICIGYDTSDATTGAINGGNLIHNNDNGIVTSASTGITLTVNENAIYDNADWGLDASGGPSVDAESNWWGDITGPGNGTTLSGYLSSAGAQPSDINGDNRSGSKEFSSDRGKTYPSARPMNKGTGPDLPVLLYGTGDDVSAEVDYSPWWGANYVGDPHTTPWQWCLDNSNASTIQECVDMASDYDTVHVCAGLYSESVSLIKPLALLGDSGAVNDVGNPNLPGVDIASSDVTVDNLTLSNCSQGILVWLEPAEYSVSPGYTNLRLTNNTIFNTNGSRGFGIYVGTESERFNPADPLGIYDPSLTSLLDFSGLYLYNNTIYNTAQAGVVLQSMKSFSDDTMKVKFNDISSTPYSGIWLDAVQLLRVTNNELHDCGYGSFLSDYADGYYEGSPDDVFDPKDIFFGYNQVYNNGSGFAIYDCWPSHLEFFHNRMMGHTSNGVYNYLPYEIDATYNYWGSDRGPTHPGNPYGDGDPVTDYVDYDPWCNQDFTICGHEAGVCDYVVGDVNGDDGYNGLDIVYGVSYFKGGSAPTYECECTPGNIWYVSGDVNGTCSYNGLDVTYGVSFLKGGPIPQPCSDCPPIVLQSGNIQQLKNTIPIGTKESTDGKADQK